MAFAQQNRPDRPGAARATGAARTAMPDAHGWPGEGAMLAAEERLQSLGASRPEARRIRDFLSKLAGLAGIAPVGISDLKAHASAIIAKSAKSGPIAIANAKQKDAERMVMVRERDLQSLVELLLRGGARRYGTIDDLQTLFADHGLAPGAVPSSLGRRYADPDMVPENREPSWAEMRARGMPDADGQRG